MRKYVFFVLSACLMIVVAGFFFWPRQPDVPLELRLELAHQRWYTSENIWYRLTVKNLGRKTILIRDPFWKIQGYNPINRRGEYGTFLQVLGPDGKEFRHGGWLANGFHGELALWANDCGGGKTCKSKDIPHLIELKAGESFVATPSMVAPMRTERRGLDDPGDLRALWAPPPKNWSREQVAQAQDEWRKIVEDSVLWGSPGYRRDPNSPPESLPAGFRVLDGYDLNKPGRYRIQATYVPLGIAGNPRDYGSIPADAKDDPREWQSVAKIFIYRSNVIEFDVVQSSYSYLPRGFTEMSREGAKKWAQLRLESSAFSRKLQKALSSGGETYKPEGKKKP